MSIEVWNLAINAEIKSPTTKAVLLGLANHASPDGKHVYPSVKRLSIYTSLSESTVRMKLAELRNAEIIKVVKKAYRYRPTEYEIDIEKLKAMKHPDLHLLEVSSSTATSRGTPAGGLEFRPPGNRHQTSGKPTSDLQPTEGEPSLTVKEPLKGKRGKNTRQPESIKTFRIKAHRFPAKSWWELIDEIVGDAEKDLELWGEIIFKWVGLGWNPMNVAGMLEFYQRREIPSVKHKYDEPPHRSVQSTREFLDDLRGGR